MSKRIWDQTGERKYETGISQVALFVQDNGTYPKGVAWNGVTAISEKPSGAEPTALWANNSKYLTLMSAEELGLTIEAYMSPEEFDECDGTVAATTGVMLAQQTRKAFGLAYKTNIGNDVALADFGYKLHLMYGGLASPSEKGYNTINESPEVNPLSWEVSTTPVSVAGYKPTSLVTIDSTKVDAEKLAELEAIIYGSADTEPRLPLPDEIISLVGSQG